MLKINVCPTSSFKPGLYINIYIHMFDNNMNSHVLHTIISCIQFGTDDITQ